MVQTLGLVILPHSDLRYKVPVISLDRVWSRTDIPDWLEQKTKTRDSFVERTTTGDAGDGQNLVGDESLNTYESVKMFPEANE
jgi:hypothetical protein